MVTRVQRACAGGLLNSGSFLTRWWEPHVTDTMSAPATKKVKHVTCSSEGASSGEQRRFMPSWSRAFVAWCSMEDHAISSLFTNSHGLVNIF